MKNTRTRILIVVATLALTAVAAWGFRQELGLWVLQRVAERNVGRNAMLDLPDGLHLALCGTGSPFPDPTRAGPCSAIIAGDRLFIVDAGEGSARNLGYTGLPAAKVEAIFLTQFHSDHIQGLGPFVLPPAGQGDTVVVLNHVVPPLPTRLAYSTFLGDAPHLFQNTIVVGEDGMLFSLPAGGTDIQTRQLK